MNEEQPSIPIPLTNYSVGFERREGHAYFLFQIQGGRHYEIPMEIIKDMLRIYEQRYGEL